MIDFNKYLVLGERTLSSGIKSDIFYDFKLLKQKENNEDLKKIINRLNRIFEKYNDVKLVGIHTMGAYISKLISKDSIIYYPKLDKMSQVLFRCMGFQEDYILFDDVYTMGGTMRKAVNCIGYPPILVIVILIRKDINGGIEYLTFESFSDKVKILELKEFLEYGDKK